MPRGNAAEVPLLASMAERWSPLAAARRVVPALLLLLALTGAGMIGPAVAQESPLEELLTDQSETETPTAISDSEPLALQINIAGAIGPATAEFVERAVEEATERRARILVIHLDTPGGLDLSTRSIIQSILQSPVPVATYVAPEGARAASAGTYILYASHIAAMSPATNVGAATPVDLIGGQTPRRPGGEEPAKGRAAPDRSADEEAADEEAADSDATDQEANGEEAAERRQDDPGDAMSRKVINDSIAYLRGLAARHGRNVEWAESAVRDAASITAETALEIGVIDLIANDVDDLLAQADGLTVMLHSGEHLLQTADLQVEQIEPGWKTELLAVITSPTIAYLLLLMGVYGLILEGYNPGAFLPGIVGAISLLLALYALQMLPVNYAGFGLIVLGLILMVAEALAPSFGVLGLGGIVALVIGSVILMDTDAPGFVVSRPLIIAIAMVGGLALMASMAFVVKARRRPVVSGREELLGATGVVLDSFDGPGFVFAHGERWNAFSSRPVRQGQPVIITGIDGLTLLVDPATGPDPAHANPPLNPD